MKHIRNAVKLAALLALPFAVVAIAQESGRKIATFDEAFNEVNGQLQEALAELDGVYATIRDEKLPLSKQLNELEAELLTVRAELAERTRVLDGSRQDLFSIRADITTLQNNVDYVSDTLTDYINKLESNLDISELQLYLDDIEDAREAAEDLDSDQSDVFEKQIVVVLESIRRLEAAIGGRMFEGRAIDPSGIQEPGKFMLVGPVALFRQASGEDIGTAETRVGTLQPTIVPFEDEEDRLAADKLLTSGSGRIPLDPTLGDAHKIASTDTTLLDEFEKGGTVMYAIVGMALASLLVALFKWITLSAQRLPSKKSMRRLLDAVADGDEEAARARAAAIRGPVGRMLAAGVEHIREPRELVEEVMYEELLTTKLKLNRLLPFVAIAAASAPLLGLLGTVTGIINTFKLITVFGSGDVKSLSGGISEALITTKYGLIVAIPSLLLHAFLSRKARGITGEMETAAVALTNQLTITPFRRSRRTAEPEVVGAGGSSPDPELVKAQVSEILGDLLGSGANGSDLPR